MKRMKKVFALLLTMVMVLAMAVPAMAATDGSITINNATINEVYTLYKVFDAVPANVDAMQNDTKQIAYTYTGTDDFYTALSGATSPFTLTKIETETNKYNVTLKTGKTSTDVTTFLKNNVSNLGTGTPETATSTTLTFSGLEYGYYYISTTTGSTVTINSAAKSVTVEDKNAVPTVDKKQNTSAGIYADADLNINIGDTVYYETTITGGKTNDKVITLVDKMSNSLDLNSNSIEVKNGTTVLKKDTDYTLSVDEDGHGFTLVLKEAVVTTLTQNSKVVVTYNATLNSTAAIDASGAARDNNKVTMTYSNQTSTDIVYVATYDALVKKVDGAGNYLEGAGFKLYDAKTGGNEIKLTAYTKTDEDAANSYYVDKNKTSAGEEIFVNNTNGVSIKGLVPGTYYLEETTVPAGYQPLANRQTVTITANATGAVDVTVTNLAGSTLPSTGGIGTTIFYVIGAILVLGAGVLLVTRRRMASK